MRSPSHIERPENEMPHGKRDGDLQFWNYLEGTEHTVKETTKKVFGSLAHRIKRL